MRNSNQAIQRNCALRFPQDANPADIEAFLDAWNTRFKESFNGNGYFQRTPVMEVFEGQLCQAFYMYADTVFWGEVEQSRTFTIDEPVVMAA